MKFALTQIIGMIGDQLTWWGEGLQERAARMTGDLIGISGTETDEEKLRALSHYIETGAMLHKPGKPTDAE